MCDISYKPNNFRGKKYQAEIPHTFNWDQGILAVLKMQRLIFIKTKIDQIKNKI